MAESGEERRPSRGTGRPSRAPGKRKAARPLDEEEGADEEETTVETAPAPKKPRAKKTAPPRTRKGTTAGADAQAAEEQEDAGTPDAAGRATSARAATAPDAPRPVLADPPANPRAGVSQPRWPKAQIEVWKDIHARFSANKSWDEMAAMLNAASKVLKWPARSVTACRLRIPSTDVDYLWTDDQLACLYDASQEQDANGKPIDNSAIFARYKAQETSQAWPKKRDRKQVLERLRQMRKDGWTPRTGSARQTRNPLREWRPEEDAILKALLNNPHPELQLSAAVIQLNELGVGPVKRTFDTAKRRLNKLRADRLTQMILRRRWREEETPMSTGGATDPEALEEDTGASAGDNSASEREEEAQNFRRSYDENDVERGPASTVGARSDVDSGPGSAYPSDQEDVDPQDEPAAQEPPTQVEIGDVEVPFEGGESGATEEEEKEGEMHDVGVTMELLVDQIGGHSGAEKEDQGDSNTLALDSSPEEPSPNNLPSAQAEELGVTAASPARVIVAPGDESQDREQAEVAAPVAPEVETREQMELSIRVSPVPAAKEPEEAAASDTAQEKEREEGEVDEEALVTATPQEDDLAESSPERDEDTQSMEVEVTRPSDESLTPPDSRDSREALRELERQLSELRVPPSDRPSATCDDIPSDEQPEWYEGLNYKIRVEIEQESGISEEDLTPALIQHVRALSSFPGSLLRDYRLDQEEDWDSSRRVGDTHISTRREGFSRSICLYQDRRNSITLASSLLLKKSPGRVMFLREVWAMHFGDCRSGEFCCLKWDITHPEFSGYKGRCRHWEYFHKGEVYLDNFAHEGDYRLSMALASHLFAKKEMSELDSSIPGKRPVERNVEVYGFGPLLSAVDEKSSDDGRFNHWRLLTGSLSIAFVGPPFGEKESGLLNTWDVGYITRRGYKAEAVILSFDGQWILLTMLSKDELRNYITDEQSTDPISSRAVDWCSLRWSPRANLLNYQRRFMAAEGAGGYKMIERMQRRIWTWTPRAQEDVERSQVASPLLARLDQDQERVVEAALQYTGIVINTGPFGCGKTRTIAICAEALWTAYPNERIAVVSEPNTAIDEDAVRIVEDGVIPRDKILRFGELKPGMEEYADIYWSTKIAAYHANTDTTGLSDKKIAEKLREFEKKVFADAAVVITTLAHAGGSKLASVQFHTVINDEAGQTLEGALIQAIRKETKLMINMGDDKQLRGYIPIDEREREQFSATSRSHKLSWSLIHSLEHEFAKRNPRDANGHCALRVSRVFRSQRSIVHFLGVFYPYDIFPARRELGDHYLQEMSLPDVSVRQPGKDAEDPSTGQTILLGERHVLWYGAEREEVRRQQLFNHVEQYLVVELLLRVRRALDKKDLFGSKTVLVVTPYKKQKILIQQELQNSKKWFEGCFDLTVENTDASQGKEADIVIVSMVRAAGLGFLRDYPARSLVSLSRARDYLFILGSLQALKEDPVWQLMPKRAALLGIEYKPVNWATEHVLIANRDVDTLEEIGGYESKAKQEAQRRDAFRQRMFGATGKKKK